MRSRFHIAIRIDFSFYAQSPLSRVCLLCIAQFWAILFVHVNKCVQSNSFVFVFITALITKTSVRFDKNICILKHRGPFRCMLIRLRYGNLIRKFEWPMRWNVETSGARLGHAFIYWSLVQVLLDIFIHLPMVLWTLVDKNPGRAWSGARDSWTVKRQWRITTTVLES